MTVQATENLPKEVADFMKKIGPRPLTADEARMFNLLRLKHGLPAASATGIAVALSADDDEDDTL